MIATIIAIVITIYPISKDNLYLYQRGKLIAILKQHPDQEPQIYQTLQQYYERQTLEIQTNLALYRETLEIADRLEKEQAKKYYELLLQNEEKTKKEIADHQKNRGTPKEINRALEEIQNMEQRAKRKLENE